MGLQVFSKMAAVVESLLTNGAGVASRGFVLLISMFTDVMPLEVVPSVKASVTHSTRKAARLTMNGLLMPLQRFLASLAQRSHTGVSPRLLGGGEDGSGGGGSGKSTVVSVGQAAESPNNTASWCIFMCLPKWSFL